MEKRNRIKQNSKTFQDLIKGVNSWQSAKFPQELSPRCFKTGLRIIGTLLHTEQLACHLLRVSLWSCGLKLYSCMFVYHRFKVCLFAAQFSSNLRWKMYF